MLDWITKPSCREYVITLQYGKKHGITIRTIVLKSAPELKQMCRYSHQRIKQARNWKLGQNKRKRHWQGIESPWMLSVRWPLTRRELSSLSDCVPLCDALTLTVRHKHFGRTESAQRWPERRGTQLGEQKEEIDKKTKSWLKARSPPLRDLFRAHSRTSKTTARSQTFKVKVAMDEITLPFRNQSIMMLCCGSIADREGQRRAFPLQKQLLKIALWFRYCHALKKPCFWNSVQYELFPAESCVVWGEKNIAA